MSDWLTASTKVYPPHKEREGICVTCKKRYKHYYGAPVVAGGMISCNGYCKECKPTDEFKTMAQQKQDETMKTEPTNKTIVLDADLLFRLHKTLREYRALVAVSQETVLERHNLKKQEELFDNLLMQGNEFLQRRLHAVEKQVKHKQLCNAAEQELMEEER